ncbi:hypothetical protein J7T55_012116 [Diaporthe amygdali]|uniref:uncharacterized protein n=1 Tax=Phomopsis amygdali TaxID=1214568 RepID=UPI0022FE4D74|nr:uncharacterized protein J7T55_012116 [Diaporthe amygdali]KAJ0123650.1 hypothetical protein J7T55_012116 [Diaporthe amygdali]
MDFTLFCGIPEQPVLPKDPSSDSFSLVSPAGSDIWRVPATAGGRDEFSGPIYATPLPLNSFRKASVTVSADFKTPYAQGGLVLLLPGTVRRSQNKDQTTFESSPQQWIKTGIEYENNAFFASVVAANPYADWSLAPIGVSKATFDMEKKHGALWIFVTTPGGQRIPLRELTWVFEEDDDREVWIGVAACMPKGDASGNGGKLSVHFEDFKVVTA